MGNGKVPACAVANHFDRRAASFPWRQDMAQELVDELVSLGPTDIQISPVGLGAWAWGDRWVWGYGNGTYTDQDIRAAFDVSLASGINFVDTAEIYGSGRSEQLLGRFIRESNVPIVVATKFFPYPWRWRRASVVTALHHSLTRLGLTQVELYQIHVPYSIIPVETWMAGLADAVEAGLTRAVGVSNYDTEQTRRAYDALARRGIPLASNQVEYSLLERKPERIGLMQFCREQNITVIAYSPIAKGVLTGKYTPENPPPGVRGRTYNRNYLKRVHPLIDLLNQIGQAHGKTAGQVALNWTICKGTVTIPGAKNLRQARENAGALGWRLTAGEVAELDRVSIQVGG
jgi:aryl-alcohol dehydrogenase-like predicted oxidoreductase